MRQAFESMVMVHLPLQIGLAATLDSTTHPPGLLPALTRSFVTRTWQDMIGGLRWGLVRTGVKSDHWMVRRQMHERFLVTQNNLDDCFWGARFVCDARSRAERARGSGCAGIDRRWREEPAVRWERSATSRA